jgi:GTP cyclohydrolase I
MTATITTTEAPPEPPPVIPDPEADRLLALEGISAMLRLAGEDPTRPGLLRTPSRVLDAWMEMTERPGDPAALLATTFDDAGPVDEMIVVGPMPFSSVCEHHLLPFTGHAWVGYLPNAEGRVVGLSKIPRLLEHFARRPQVQERLTSQITAALDHHIHPLGSACVIRALHSCATLRGVRKPAPMTTSSITGRMRESAPRAEFLGLVASSPSPS